MKVAGMKKIIDLQTHNKYMGYYFITTSQLNGDTRWRLRQPMICTTTQSWQHTRTPDCVTHPLPALVVGLALGQFVVVVGKLEVDASAVDVDV